MVKLIKKKKKFLHSSLRFLWIYINKASLRLIFTVSPLRANEYRGKMSRIADTALNLRTQFYLNVHVAEGMRFWGNEELQITCTESCASRRYPRPSYSSNFFNYSVHLRINISCFKQCTFLVTLDNTIKFSSEEFRIHLNIFEFKLYILKIKINNCNLYHFNHKIHTSII